MATSLLPPQAPDSELRLRKKPTAQSQPQQPQANNNKPNKPNDLLYAFYRYLSAIISTVRNSINFADNFKHNADLCEGIGLQVLSDTSIITSFFGVLAKIMEWFEKHAPREQKLKAELATINALKKTQELEAELATINALKETQKLEAELATINALKKANDEQLKRKAQIENDPLLKRKAQIENDELLKRKAQIEAELYKIKQKYWWLWNAALYFTAYLARGALMLATLLGATAFLMVIGSGISFGASIFYAGFNLVNTWSAFREACKDQVKRDPKDRQSAWSLLFYDTKNRRSYLAEIFGCTSILLSGLITLSLFGILSFPPTAIIAFGAVTLAFSTAYFGFWAYGRYSAKQSDEQASKAADEKKEESASDGVTNDPTLSASLRHRAATEENSKDSEESEAKRRLLEPRSSTPPPSNSVANRPQDPQTNTESKAPASILAMWAPLRANDANALNQADASNSGTSESPPSQAEEQPRRSNAIHT